MSSCGLPVCLSGIQLSSQSQVVAAKRSECCCDVQRGQVPKTIEINLRKDCSANRSSSPCCSLSSHSISHGAESSVNLPVASGEAQFVEKRPICTLSKRRRSLLKQMMELDQRREALKQQRHRAQQLHSAPYLIQALLPRLELLSEDGFHSTAANAA